MIRKFSLLVAITSGCFHSVGPVIVDAYMDHGTFHLKRCDLILPSNPWAVGYEHLEACHDETGKPVDPPVSLR
jgi:hypothetical protein